MQRHTALQHRLGDTEREWKEMTGRRAVTHWPLDMTAPQQLTAAWLPTQNQESESSSIE